jgi:hypothetical protein
LASNVGTDVSRKLLTWVFERALKVLHHAAFGDLQAQQGARHPRFAHAGSS